MSGVRVPSLTPSKAQVRVPGCGSSRALGLRGIRFWEPILSSGSDERRKRRARAVRVRATAVVATAGLAVALGLLKRALGGSSAEPTQSAVTASPAEHKEPAAPRTEELSRFQEFLIHDRKLRILLLILIQPALWLQLFEYTRSPRFGEAFIVPGCIGIAIAIFGLIQGKARLGAFETVLNIEATFSVLIAIFSILYWNYGSIPNFSSNLSHLDAIYFAVGTLTTAGTGSISAESEIARGIQTIQMVLDLALIVFAVAVVLTALTSSRQASRGDAAESLARKKPVKDSD